MTRCPGLRRWAALIALMALIALLASTSWAGAANQVVKCVIDGRVTFQNTPCPADKPSRQPTTDELNAARKKRLAEAAAQRASEPADAAATVVPAAPAGRASKAPPQEREPAYRCDGRQHCSQMRSCAEAKYFLAHCPGVKMDGDRDGIPCEQQWCNGGAR